MDHVRYIFASSLRRAEALAGIVPPFVPLLAVAGLVPPGRVQAANTIPFEPVATLTPDQAQSVDAESGALFLQIWTARGMAVRSGHSNYQCLANLTAALDLVGQLNASEYNGAAGALSLLPTAGALLGAPTREMWIVYKLVPMAGLLSMFLSLGGSITPSNVGDYDPAEPFSYGGFMPTTRVRTTRGYVPPAKQPREKDAVLEDPTAVAGALSRSESPQHAEPTADEQATEGETAAGPATEGQAAASPLSQQDDNNGPDANRSSYVRFAKEVLERSAKDSGGNIRLKIFLAMALQFVLVICILIPLWYAQRGAVVVWWCRVWGWMYFWYFLVSAVSIFDNLVAAPFTRSWTVRVSRRPSGIILDRTVPKLTDREKYVNALEAIKAGPNTNQYVRIDRNKASGYSRTCFYVIVSIRGISAPHATAQVVAKGASVAVFAFGTALFASAALMSISVALMVLCVLLTCGVVGRVLAMWIVSQISSTQRPILHKLVHDEAEAGEYIHALAEQESLQLELSGHILIDGYCVHSRSSVFATSTYIGLLAKPFNVLSLAKHSWADGGSTSVSHLHGSHPTPLSSRDTDRYSGIEMTHY